MQNSTDYLFTTPSSTFVSENLLFFDTFSHSGSEKNNFDLVQFPSPVIIDLIKIVPLGQPIEAKIPGNVRLGATNPSKCELEFFINDLSKEDAHTMTDLGKFFCTEKDTDFNPPLQVQTDGLLLRGSYRTLTLAIFGQIAAYEDKNDEDPTLLSAASPPAQTPASPVASERDLAYVVARSDDHEVIRSNARRGSGSVDESTIKSSELVKDDSLIDNDNIEDTVIDYHGQNASRDHIITEDISFSECGPSASSISREKKMVENDFSNSLDADSFTKHINKSDEPIRHAKISPELNENTDELDDGLSEENAYEWCFKSDLYQPKSLNYFVDPSLTLHERTILVKNNKSGHPKYTESIEKDIKRLKDQFDFQIYSSEARTDDRVILVEELANDVANMSLAQTLTNQEMIEFLVKQVCLGLDLDTALEQKQTGHKVRHLRAGIKLATILFHCGHLVVDALLQASIPHKLIELFNKDYMSLPMKLLIVKCLSTACDTLEGVKYIISHRETMSSKFSLKRLNQEILNQAHNDPSCIKTESDLVHNCEQVDGDMDTEEQQQLTCYQALIIILLIKQTTRVKIAIGSLIKKIRLYKILSDLSDISSVDENCEDDESKLGSFQSQPKESILDHRLNLIQDVVKLIKDLPTNIVQPARLLPAEKQFQVKQPTNDAYLPLYKWLKHFGTIETVISIISTDLVVPHDNTSLSELERSSRLQNLCLTFLFHVLNSPQGVQFLLTAHMTKTTLNILTSLKSRQFPKRPPHMRMSDEIDAFSSSSLYRKELQFAAKCCDLYLKMVYSFKVFSCIDGLFHFHRQIISKNAESTVTEPERILHQLYIISNHPYGLDYLIKHLSCIGNLDCLLRFFDMPDYHKQLEFVKETSVDYALELVGTFLRLNNDVLVIYDEYLDTFVDLSKTKDKNLSVRIKSLIPWLSPFEVDHHSPLITYSEETFKNLTMVIRKSIPNHSIPFAKGLDFELPPKLITAVRILRQLCIPTQVESLIDSIFDTFSAQRQGTSDGKSVSFMAFVDSFPHHQNQNQSWNLLPQNSGISNSSNAFDDPNGEQSNQLCKLFQPYDESICGELKYHYAIMQLYEQDGYRRLLNTLRELVGNYPKPNFQSAALSDLRGRIVLSYINSVIMLLQSLIYHLIDARGSEFQDTSIIPVILETYSLLCFTPKPDPIVASPNGDKNESSIGLAAHQRSLTIKSDNFQMAQKTKKLILAILTGFTQMCLSVSESEEKVISKSMWTRMLKEVFEFTMSAPIFFQHGLEVLTKLLPPPLPCHSVMDSTDQEQLFKNINHRKLWSAHLHPLHQQIEQMISSLSICYDSNIRALLCYFCNQLCDLSSNAACMVVKIITDSLISCAARLSRETNGNSSPDHGNTQPLVASQQTSLVQAPQTEDRINNCHLLSGAKESAYVAKTLLNLLSNLITNQAFESAFSNQLQSMGKKDEKLLVNLQNTLKFHDDYRPGDQLDDVAASSSTTGSLTSVSQLIESIKSMAGNRDAGSIATDKLIPPESLTKINLVELARKATTDRFSLSSNLKNTYRLKVLMDLKSRESLSHSSSQRTSEQLSSYNYPDPASSSAHKIPIALAPPPYVAPLPRSRIARPVARPDSFRSRPQNTSRPPSIHVDDFVDLYGDNSSHQSSSSRHLGGGSKSSDYRSVSSRGYLDLGSQSAQNPPPNAPHSDLPNHRHSYFSPPPPASGLPYGSRSSQHSKSKYMKLK